LRAKPFTANGRINHSYARLADDRILSFPITLSHLAPFQFALAIVPRRTLTPGSKPRISHPGYKIAWASPKHTRDKPGTPGNLLATDELRTKKKTRSQKATAAKANGFAEIREEFGGSVTDSVRRRGVFFSLGFRSSVQ